MIKVILMISLFGLSLFGCGRQVENKSDLVVNVYDSEKAFDGTTLLTDGHDPKHFKVLEVNMKGEVVWEYEIPSELIKGQLVGFDAELIDNGNILIVLSGSGVYEVDREGNIVWSYLDAQVSHDADRLENGNTLVNFGNNDKKIDAAVKEISPDGEVVWDWFAKDVYGQSKFKDLEPNGGWVHANGVQRLSNGNTMVSLRNFYLTAIIDKNGDLVEEFDWSKFGQDVDPHEPVIDEVNNSMLVCLQNDSEYVAVEIDMLTQETLWTYTNKNLRTARDCNKLANGNILITAVDNGGTKSDQSDDYSAIIEITPDGEIVWRLDLENFAAEKSPGFFFKAERI